MKYNFYQIPIQINLNICKSRFSLSQVYWTCSNWKWFNANVTENYTSNSDSYHDFQKDRVWTVMDICWCKDIIIMAYSTTAKPVSDF